MALNTSILQMTEDRLREARAKLDAIEKVLDDAESFGDEVDPGDIRKILEA